ncbi:MAG: hypothetical protein IT364_23610, partial [Candidatus Hydrogenedentes bacterium]|nr:hypothetical protein [Candidatus Hydrogenedentota bacterium]
MNAWLFSALVWTALAGAGDSADVVAHFAFDEGSGTVLHDRSGHVHEGTIAGARWASADKGGGLNFGEGRDGGFVDFGDNRA